ncbi:hypothetical protein WBP07_22240 (plasmid) [Novosphingobium sp. BL-8A]|uniref:hypothetical protein n=1 Tax=Novosphingobium sp. BL-8A TaxID=3127639 RepID=UPI003757C6BF
MKFKLIALALGCLSISASVNAEEGRSPSTLCTTGDARDIIHLRIISPGISFRVPPSSRYIIEKGTDQYLVRSVFAQYFQKTLCEQSFPEITGATDHFDKRIVVYVEGEEDRELLSLTYPSWEDQPPPVWARMNGKTVLMPARFVRHLLDLTRG